jgi:hypothetical protein
MRRQRIQPKTLRRIPIPDDLRAALEETHALIVEAEDDPDIHLAYSDAIQSGPLCGGRIGTAARPYLLTYYARSGDRWELAFSSLEISDVADGHTQDLRLYCCVAEDCDSKFSLVDQACSRCDYIEDSRFGTFKGPEAEARLREAGLSPEAPLTREGIVAALGEPTEVGGDIHWSGSYVWPWVKFHFPDRQLRVEFDKHGHVRDVTLLEPDWEPGR